MKCFPDPYSRKKMGYEAKMVIFTFKNPIFSLNPSAFPKRENVSLTLVQGIDVCIEAKIEKF
jgi:hypothetical protein